VTEGLRNIKKILDRTRSGIVKRNILSRKKVQWAESSFPTGGGGTKRKERFARKPAIN
jgi:hypothetical protein